MDEKDQSLPWDESPFTPIQWDRTAMEWRQLITSPFCDLTPTQKHILTTTCRFGNKYGEDIFPSQRAIAFRAGVALRSVNTCMQTAKEDGWIIRHMIPIGEGRARTIYNLSVPLGISDIGFFFRKARYWLPPYKYAIKRTETGWEMTERVQ